jgi:hypothetical protein
MTIVRIMGKGRANALSCANHLLRRAACATKRMKPYAVASGLAGDAPSIFTSRAQGLDLYRVCQIADVLDVSLDWLTGRSNVMDVMEMPDLPARP